MLERNDVSRHAADAAVVSHRYNLGVVVERDLVLRVERRKLLVGHLHLAPAERVHLRAEIERQPEMDVNKRSAKLGPGGFGCTFNCAAFLDQLVATAE